MSRDQLICKVETSKAKLQKEIRLRQKLEKEMIDLEKEDHLDLKEMMDQIKSEDMAEDMHILWEQQKNFLQTQSSKQYRWHPKIIKICVEMYSKNPHVLDPLRKVICLPSNRTIRHHKNKIEEKSGWNREILKWCLDEAKKQNLKECDYWGGLVLDEMKIQENIEMVVKNGKHRLVGFVDLGEIHDNMEYLSGKATDPQLASHVLQFIFVSDCGFRFPVAQFPSGGCTASDLFFAFWDGVDMMYDTGFTVYWTILDGAEVNSQFIKMQFKDEQECIDNNFVVPNVSTGGVMIFMLDPKHNFKKIKNNILKSSPDGSGTRLLTICNQHIVWEQFVNAFHYDQGTFSLSYHHKLALNHFELDPASKMRNHLAEEVPDRDMLKLMKAYKCHLTNKGQDGSQLDATIKLLNHTSKTISLFSDKLIVNSRQDERLEDLKSFLGFLTDWKSNAAGDPKKFVTDKLWFDMQSMILGFLAIIAVKLKKFPNSVIKPAIINQDCVENHFCQVRSYNGQNNNPTWRLQQNAQNAIRHGQSSMSRKGNAGKTGLKKMRI